MNKLSEAEIKIIKSFDPQVIQYVKNKLRCNPVLKTNGQWIINACKQRSNEMHIPLPQLLNNLGFTHCAKKAHENHDRATKESRNHNGSLNAKTYSRVEATAEIERILKDEEYFLKNINLFGQETAEMIRNKEVEHIINNITE